MSGTWDDEPDEWDDQVTDDCMHEEAEVDILTGELRCHCGYHRTLSGEELKREIELQAECTAAYERELGANNG